MVGDEADHPAVDVDVAGRTTLYRALLENTAIVVGSNIERISSMGAAIEGTVAFELAAQYREMKDTWSAVYAPQLELARQGVTESLWRAPGE